MEASQTTAPAVETLVNSQMDQTQSLEVSAPSLEPKARRPRTAPKAPPNADRPPGKSLLPLARVQRIMKADKVRLGVHSGIALFDTGFNALGTS